MRQYVYIALLAVVVAAPFVLRAAIRGPGGTRAAPAGARRLVVITPHNQDIRREFGRAFSAWHLTRHGAPVSIDYRVPGGANDVKRQLADTYRSWQRGGGVGGGPDRSLDPNFAADIHVAFGGGDFFFDSELKPLGILQPMHLDPHLLADAFPEPALAGVALYERTTDRAGVPTPQWVGVCLSGFGIVYNADACRGLGLAPPRGWHDLTDARLAGQLSLADPTHSGSAGVAYMTILQRRMVDAEEALFKARPDLATLSAADRRVHPDYRKAIGVGWKRGMSELLLIAANARYFTDSSSQVANDVGGGDAAAGISIDFYGRVYQEIVGPERCRVILPAGATAITPDPVGILAGVKGEDLVLATRFVEFLLSPQGQRVWIVRPGGPHGPSERALRRLPVRRDVYADRTDWTDDVNPFLDAHGFNQRGDLMDLFTDTRPVWTAAWLDGREGLKSAYAAALGVKDQARRDALIAELADLPVTMDQVREFRTRRQSHERAGDAERWKANHRIELTKQFRAHYAAVEGKAR
jgi:ABC-type Fe3+ transport system substrate-binding protein